MKDPSCLNVRRCILNVVELATVDCASDDLSDGIDDKKRLPMSRLPRRSFLKKIHRPRNDVRDQRGIRL
jgi:hypothetical protein